MNDYAKTIWSVLLIIILLWGCIIGTIAVKNYVYDTPTAHQSKQFGGYVPMDVYTGVYYAVTEKGGICVMETMSGETKLVDQGDGVIIHPNQGE